jgi:signal transduction histidine kinase
MREKILLVDDREDNILSLEAILEPDGYELVKAQSGQQALKILLKEVDFALILMDVKMPGLNGFETAALIYEREKLRHVPVIFITANNSGDENIYRGYKAGAVDFIHKPLKPRPAKSEGGGICGAIPEKQPASRSGKKLVAINKSLQNEIREKNASEEKVKELNSQLMTNIAKLEATNKDLDNFVFMASHDMQEPLRKIRMFANYLSETYLHLLDEQGKKFINRIQVSSERMQQLINDLLNFSRVSKADESFVVTDLTELAKDVSIELKDALEERKGRLVIENLPSLPVNPNLIRSLFYNLIHNSIKYSKKEVPPEIKVYVQGEKKPAEEIESGVNGFFYRIVFEDNGIGFEQKYAEQIFDIFKRLHIRSEFEGTGIGLALCKKIVEKHQGGISAHSKLSEGSQFIVSLPIRSDYLLGAY